MTKKVDSLKHKADKRAHIPSKEEAGTERENPKVLQGNKTLELPLNPVTTRGQDPELFWMNKYGNDDREALLRVDIRSLYRHEHIAPEKLIQNLHRVVVEQSAQPDLFSINETFGNALERDELEKVGDYYTHSDGWTNRLIQGDSHLVMASLLEREGMAGQVQMIYLDPPYGIKYGSNWQIKLNNRDVKDGADEALTGEPEVIKAFRDTWELGIHSYLSYLRDRLLIAKELLTDSGSCFVQISDENVHLVRSVMDEVFGSENFQGLVVVQKTESQSSTKLSSVCDYLVWYAKDRERLKYRKLFLKKQIGGSGATGYVYLESPDGLSFRTITKEEKVNPSTIPEGWRLFDGTPLVSESGGDSTRFPVHFDGKEYWPGKNFWKTNEAGFSRLMARKRIVALGNRIEYKRYFDDFPVFPIANLWTGMGERGFVGQKLYVVQTAMKVIERCLLMTTDPGDLVLDPTCGSGTTAYVAEQFGRRWLTIDTSRIALNIAKTRLMTATFPYYHLYSEVSADYAPDKNGKLKPKIKPLPEGEQTHDIRQGFVYEKVPHIKLEHLTNDEPPDTETLYDQPYEDKKRLRVCGPFTVETLQNFEPVAPAELDDELSRHAQADAFEEVVRQHLLSTGVKNGRKDEQVIFTRVELLAHEYLHAEGFYQTPRGERKAYFHLGPKFGTVSKTAVNEAIKECRTRGDADWLVILGFSFESDIQGSQQTTSLGTFEVTKARIHDDLLQEGLKKKPGKAAASFVTIGEPDVALEQTGGTCTVEIRGLDIYDPIKDEVKPRDLHDIAYWMVDDDYDGSNFVVKQVFFCGGDRDEFDKWKKGLSDLAKQKVKEDAGRLLKIEIDDEAFDRLYGFRSHPIAVKKKGQRIAVRLVSQFGEESTKVFTLNA
ncbi:MAG: site-specific DNA-methyltransferase [Blastocatellales bacterium]